MSEKAQAHNVLWRRTFSSAGYELGVVQRRSSYLFENSMSMAKSQSTFWFLVYVDSPGSSVLRSRTLLLRFYKIVVVSDEQPKRKTLSYTTLCTLLEVSIKSTTTPKGVITARRSCRPDDGRPTFGIFEDCQGQDQLLLQDDQSKSSGQHVMSDHACFDYLT